MAKGKKKGRKGSGLKGAIEMAAAGIGLAAMAYDAYRGYQAAAAGRDGGERAKGGLDDGWQAAAGFADAAARAIRREPGPTHRPMAAAEAGPAGGLAEAGTTARAAGAIGTATALAKALVDLNRASPDMLMSLRKIGKKRARKIVAHRPFGRVKDLKKVLPKRVYKAVKGHLTV